MRYTVLPVTLFLMSCDITGGTGHEERAWAASPDGHTHAVLIETNGGATTSFGYLVELHPADHLGEKPVRVADLYRVTSDCEFGPAMRWADANTLVLEIGSADQIRVARSANVGGTPVRVMVKTGVENTSDPCRGMKGRPRKM